MITDDKRHYDDSLMPKARTSVAIRIFVDLLSNSPDRQGDCRWSDKDRQALLQDCAGMPRDEVFNLVERYIAELLRSIRGGEGRARLRLSALPFGWEHDRIYSAIGRLIIKQDIAERFADGEEVQSELELTFGFNISPAERPS